MHIPSQCQAGKFTANFAASKCDPCEDGTYSPLPGASACIDCDPGFFRDDVDFFYGNDASDGNQTLLYTIHPETSDRCLGGRAAPARCRVACAFQQCS